MRDKRAAEVPGAVEVAPAGASARPRDGWERHHDGRHVARVLCFADLGYHVSASDASGFTVVQGTLAPSLDAAREAADALIQLVGSHRCGRTCRGWLRLDPSRPRP
jgi:hypothetical protein